MKILVIGGGGREHALCWALSRSATIFCAPGNPGTATVGTNLPISALDFDAIVEAVARHGIDLTVVGPEAPLAAGLVDRLVAAGYRAFGPSGKAAQLEASKAYAKEVMRKAGVPTAHSATFTTQPAALGYASTHAEPLVVKASGLAAGKGAIICETRAEAEDTIRDMFGGKFGEAGKRVLVEEFLEGEELSILAMTDGEHILLLPPSQDHKRLQEGDRGPNTGGMGAYSPVALADDVLLRRCRRDIVAPILSEMAGQGAPFRGILYAGIMVSPEGKIDVLEFNCRLGDPEAQAVLPLTGAELAEHMWSIANGDTWDPKERSYVGAAVTTVLAASGYPGAPVKGTEIHIPAELPPNTLLFHAGTTRDASGVLRTSGGRVLCATGLGIDVQEATARSHELAAVVDFEGMYYRRDIAWRERARAGTP
ncbi:MAG: phosphoribosylamine--glycine ligase [Gemmatimonadales bacterium]